MEQTQNWSQQDFVDFMLAVDEPRPLLCTQCGKPCGIIHDLEISACCYSPISIEEGRRQ